MTTTSSGHLERRSIHHIAFDVPDVSTAIKFFAATFGMGPFYRLQNPRGDDPSHLGAGFGWWGGIFVELIPAPSGSTDGPPSINHVAYMSTEPAAESQRLSDLGMKKFLEFRNGNVWPQFHDASHEMGCAIEIHQACAELDEFFELVASSSQDWDGQDLERAVPAPGH